VPKSPAISVQAADFINDFIKNLADTEDLGGKTLNEYASDLKDFAHWFEEWSPGKNGAAAFSPEEITTPTIVHYRDNLQNDRCLKPATINRRLNTLKRYFNWALNKGVIACDCSKPVKLIPEEKTSPRQLTDKEEAALVSTAEKHGTARDRTIIIVMLHTGLRSMEICGLKVADVSINKRSGLITVRSGKRNKQREVPINATARTVLNPYIDSLPSGCECLFPSGKTGQKLTERALRHLMEKYTALAGLKGVSAHDLRHRFGYVMSGKTPLHRLAQIMGHDSLNTTMIYTQATQADLQSEVEKIAWQ